MVGLAVLLMSYLLLAWRGALLVYHGFEHDSAAAHSAASAVADKGVLVDQGHRWRALTGWWRELGGLLGASFHEGFGLWGGKNSELGEHNQHPLQTSWSVISGVVTRVLNNPHSLLNSPAGEMLYVACICYTIAFLFSPPLHGTELQALRNPPTSLHSQHNQHSQHPQGHDLHEEEEEEPPHNLYLQTDLGLAGHVHHFGASVTGTALRQPHNYVTTQLTCLLCFYFLFTPLCN